MQPTLSTNIWSRESYHIYFISGKKKFGFNKVFHSCQHSSTDKRPTPLSASAAVLTRFYKWRQTVCQHWFFRLFSNVQDCISRRVFHFLHIYGISLPLYACFPIPWHRVTAKLWQYHCKHVAGRCITKTVYCKAYTVSIARHVQQLLVRYVQQRCQHRYNTNKWWN